MHAVPFKGEALCAAGVGLEVPLERGAAPVTFAAAPATHARLELLLEKEAAFAAARKGVLSTDGTVEFDGLRMAAGPDVLRPRRASEAVVARGVALAAADGATSASVLDLGTGSGCLLIAALLRLRRAGLTAKGAGVDRCPAALQVAAHNAAAHGLGPVLVQGTFRDPPREAMVPGGFDLVLCNPPYHSRRDSSFLDAATQDEPPLALFVDAETDAPDDPLVFYRDVLAAVATLLRPGGALVFEVCGSNAEAVRTLMSDAGLGAVEMGRDATGCVRTLEGRWAPRRAPRVLVGRAAAVRAP